jgi:hypothetical protein
VNAQNEAPVARCDTSMAVDRVLAVVGDAPVLSSQLEEEIYAQRAQGAPAPSNPEELRSLCRAALSRIVDVEVLVQQATRDTSIKVTDQEISDGVEEQIKNIRGRFTSEVDYRNELKKAGFQTPEEYRRWLTDQQRQAALQNRLIDKMKEREDQSGAAHRARDADMRRAEESARRTAGYGLPSAISSLQPNPIPRLASGRGQRPIRSCAS